MRSAVGRAGSESLLLETGVGPTFVGRVGSRSRFLLARSSLLAWLLQVSKHHLLRISQDLLSLPEYTEYHPAHPNFSNLSTFTTSLWSRIHTSIVVHVRMSVDGGKNIYRIELLCAPFSYNLDTGRFIVFCMRLKVTEPGYSVSE